MTMFNLEFKFFLENNDLQVVEVRLIGLESIQGDGSRWLRIDRKTSEIAELNLQYKDSSGEIEERYFNEGYLKFNDSIGTFIEKFNSAQHPLQRKSDFVIEAKLETVIHLFLRVPSQEAEAN